MTDDYAPHRDFIRPARGVTQPKIVLGVFGLFVFAFFAWPFVIMMVLPLRAQIAFYEGTSAAGTLAQFGIFGLSAIVFIKVLRRYHDRGFWSLIGPYRAAWDDFRAVVIAVGIVLTLLQFGLSSGALGEPSQYRNLFGWLLLLPVAVLAILVQVTTEEMVFRGYLQQQLACLSSNPLLWMVLPSLMFGGWHYWNANSAAEGLVYVFWAVLLGLACADLTARTGTLGAAIGLHLATNFTAIMFFATEGWPMSGLALVLYPYQDVDEISAEIAAVAAPWVIFSMLIMGLSVLIVWLAARIAVRR